MAIFNSYVSLPEGTPSYNSILQLHFLLEFSELGLPLRDKLYISNIIKLFRPPESKIEDAPKPANEWVQFDQHPFCTLHLCPG